MSYYQKFFSDFKTEFYMYATLGIILSSCIGAAAAMLILTKGHGMFEMFQLFLVTCVCMWFNTTVLANLKPKLVFNSLLVSLFLNILIIVYYIATL